ncbi:MAG: hypothetical protein PHO12_02855 [Bacteroidales bacterium]|nr:hypothetical protein [Bacteroidales bacterium]MDD4684333.1 hypothetical protein [Bacteroidales bacterium]
MIVLTDLQRCKLDLAGLKQDNVEEFVEKSYYKWLYYNSDKVTIDGEEIEKSKRFHMMVPINEKGDMRTGKVEMSCKNKDGFDLTKELFKNEQLKKCEPVYQETIGSVKYRELNLKLKLFIDYLKNQFLLPQETTKSIDSIPFEKLKNCYMFQFTKEEEKYLVSIKLNRTNISEFNSNFIKNYTIKNLKDSFTIEEKTNIINNDIKNKLLDREKDIDYLIIFKAIESVLEVSLNFYKDSYIENRGFIDIIGDKILSLCSKLDSTCKDYSNEEQLKCRTNKLKEILADLIDILYPYSFNNDEYDPSQKEFHKEYYLNVFDEFIIQLPYIISKEGVDKIYDKDFLRNSYVNSQNIVNALMMGKQEAREYPRKDSFDPVISQRLQKQREDSIDALNPENILFQDLTSYTTLHYFRLYDKDKVSIIYNEFIKHRIIESTTKIIDFEYVFGFNIEHKNDFKPINWIKSQNLLAYFVNKFFSENDSNYLQIAEYCFKIKGEQINKKKMSSFISEMKSNKASSPNYYKIIDEALKL